MMQHQAAPVSTQHCAPVSEACVVSTGLQYPEYQDPYAAAASAHLTVAPHGVASAAVQPAIVSTGHHHHHHHPAAGGGGGAGDFAPAPATMYVNTVWGAGGAPQDTQSMAAHHGQPAGMYYDAYPAAAAAAAAMYGYPGTHMIGQDGSPYHAGLPHHHHHPQQGMQEGGAGGGGGGGGGGKRKRRRVISYEQRKAANVRERKRMCHLNDAFDVLRKRVPTFAYEKKLSRIETLKLAVTYIQYMAELLDDIEDKGSDCNKSNGTDASPTSSTSSSGMTSKERVKAKLEGFTAMLGLGGSLEDDEEGEEDEEEDDDGGGSASSQVSPSSSHE